MPESISRNINFVEEQENTNLNFRDQIFQWIIGSGRKIIIITQIVILIIFGIRFKINRDLNIVSEDLERTQAQLIQLQDDETDIREVQTKLTAIQTLIDNQTNWNQRVDTVNSKVPFGMQLNTLSFNGKSISIAAKVNNAVAFQTFMGLLISDENIAEIVLLSSNYIESDDIYTFSLNIGLLE